MPNVVINTAVAKVLADMADVLEAAVANGEDFSAAVAAVIKDTLTAHKRIIYNGNGYSQEWLAEAARRGLSNLRTTVESCEVLTSEKSVELFTRFGVLSSVELHARQEILLENYAKVLNIEAQTMILMATRQIIPAVENYITRLGKAARAKMAVLGDNSACIRMERELISRLSELNTAAYDAVAALRQADREAQAAGGALAVATAFRDKVVPAMASLRASVDEMETLVASEDWPLPTYGEMMHKQ
jgi:glutamine synthetase